MVEQDSQEKLTSIREEVLQQLFERMFSVMKQIHREIHRDVNPLPPLLSPPQARLIFTIAKYKDQGLSVKELANIANITPGAITQFVDALIKKGLVTREEDQNDRRIVRLKLTPAAKNQMETFKKNFLTTAARKFEVFSIEELRQLDCLLAKVSPEPFNKDNQL